MQRHDFLPLGLVIDTRYQIIENMLKTFSYISGSNGGVHKRMIKSHNQKHT